MKKTRFITIAFAALTALTFTSCDQDDSLTDVPQVGVKFNTVTSPISLNNDNLRATEQTKELAFTSGFITLSEIEFEVETDDDSVEINFEIEQNTIVDYATGETNPDISFVQIPAGTYNEMEVEIELQDEGDTPAMVLYGTYIDVEGMSHEVRFEYNSGETFEVEQEGTIVFETNESALAQITFDPRVWFAGVSNEQLARAKKDDNGVIVISETQNTEIFDIVADGLDLATEVEIEMY